MLKLIVLGILIVGCIWQTMILWLGDLSSHNFLQQTQTMHHIIVQPRAIWVNVGNLAYNIQENIQGIKSEYEIRLMDELIEQIKGQRIKLEIDKSLTFDSVFNKRGIIYEYGTYLALDEIVGMSITKETEEIRINNILVDLGDYDEHKTYLYLIGRESDPIYKVTLLSKLETHYKIIKNVNLDNNQITYQPSSTRTTTLKEYIEGNVFLPNVSQTTPMIYEPLVLMNNIQQDTVEETKNRLSSYVNTFFANPLVKEVEIANDGSIIYREGQKTSVRYNPVGTLEFSIATATESDRLSMVDKIIEVNNFVEKSPSIPKSIKRGLYLSNITEQKEKGETTYQFDYQYEGMSVLLTERFKEAVGVNAMLELVVKNNQIVRGKWVLMDIEVDSEGAQRKGELKKGFNSVIDDVYKGQKLQDIRCSYIIDKIDAPITFNWVIKYTNNNENNSSGKINNITTANSIQTRSKE